MIKFLIALLIGYVLGYVLCSLKIFGDIKEIFPDLYAELNRRLDDGNDN